MKAERDKIAARIRALLAKTVDNGCTEDEAISAAHKAAAMLAQYNLTLDEVMMRETPFTRHSERHEDDVVGQRLWRVGTAIAFVTGARYWSNRVGEPVGTNFFGFDHEVLVATYLLAICERAMRQEHARLKHRWRLVDGSRQRRKIMPFIDGMADRLHDRIKALKQPEPESTGKGLIVLRNELLDAALNEIGIKLSDRRIRASLDLDDAYRDGLRAGQKVSLNRGVDGPARNNRLLS